MNTRYKVGLTTILMLISSATFSQDLTHPRDMDIPASKFTRPAPEQFQVILDNGLTAYVAKADQVPLVTLSAFVRAGKIDGAKEGAAESMIHALQNSGPGDMSAADFKDALRRMTARYTVTMHDEWTEISLNVPTEDLPEALYLFTAIIRTPNIHQDNIEGARITATRDAAVDDAGVLFDASLNVAVDKFRDVVYDGHRYGKNLTNDEFDALTIADIAEFHRNYFAPNNMTIAVSGDIDEASIRATLSERFADWAPRELPERRVSAPLDDNRSAVHHYAADKFQTWLVMGHALPEVPLEEQAALEIMNYVLGGGHFWTRLFINTRDRYGLTNDASGFPEEHWDGPGNYSFRTYSRHDVVKQLYDNVMEEVHRIREEKVSEEDLLIAQNALADGTFEIRYNDGNAIARSFAIEQLRYGGHEHSASYRERVLNVTIDDVLKAANKYIRPDAFQIVVVGDDIDLD